MVGLHHHIRIFIINSHDGRRETHWNVADVQLMLEALGRRWKVMMKKTHCDSYLTSEFAFVNIIILIRALSSPFHDIIATNMSLEFGVTVSNTETSKIRNVLSGKISKKVT